MNKRIFVGVDAQHDFIDGVLGSKEARATVGDLGKSAKFARACGFDVYWTTDIHEKDDYPLSQEGKNLPIYHGEPMAWGSQLHEDCGLAPGDKIISKSTFGSNFLAHDLTNKDGRGKICMIDRITLEQAKDYPGNMMVQKFVDGEAKNVEDIYTIRDRLWEGNF